ncbi:hypothetical protein [[Eubacterium] cellulosolvens]
MTAPKGATVRFNIRSKGPTETKRLAGMKSIEEIMDWNPRRTEKEETINPKMMKKIWKNGSE